MAAAVARPGERVVLVVDDEEVVRLMTARILHDAGFRVLEAHDGEEAVTLLATLGPKIVWLVVTDISMPGITGTDLAKTMTERWPAISILLISGRDVPPPDYRGGFLAKPFLPDTLVAAVKALLPPMGTADDGQENAPGLPRIGTPWWDPRLPIA